MIINGSMLVMAKKVISGMLFFLVFSISLSCSAAVPETQVLFPYRLEGRGNAVAAGSVNPLLLVVSGGFDQTEYLELQVQLPPGLSLSGQMTDDWQTVGDSAQGQQLTRSIELNHGYDNWFSFVYLQCDADLLPGDGRISLTVSGDGRVWKKTCDFQIAAARSVNEPANASWTIQRLEAPVDHYGERDARQEGNVIYLRDNILEELRSRLSGQGGADWASISRHPFSNVAVYVRNPAGSQELLRVKAELFDANGVLLQGLGQVTAHPNDEESNADVSVAQGKEQQVEYALLALDGRSEQRLVMPLHGDIARFQPGAATLRLTITGAADEQIASLPVRFVVRRESTMAVLGTAVCALLALGAFLRWRGGRLLSRLDARGVITIALFGAVSFGAITVPVTLAGEMIHVLLGPFSPLISGLFSGVLMYLLLLALVRLYPMVGVISFTLLLKWLLTAIVFGRISLIGIGGLAVHAVLLEGVLYATGWTGFSSYARRRLPLWALAISCGLADMVVTYVNMELMIFFYRLFYADWYIALYVFLNGLLYSSIGVWLGVRVGDRLIKVTGE